jgi:hypothetical protein
LKQAACKFLQAAFYWAMADIEWVNPSAVSHPIKIIISKPIIFIMLIGAHVY